MGFSTIPTRPDHLILCLSCFALIASSNRAGQAQKVAPQKAWQEFNAVGEEFREEELRKCTRKLSNANLNEKELEAVERLSRGIVNKLLHGPMAHLRKTESVEGKQATLKELSAMFRLEEDQMAGRGRRRAWRRPGAPARHAVPFVRG